jgi:hypothetical protein
MRGRGREGAARQGAAWPYQREMSDAARPRQAGCLGSDHRQGAVCRGYQRCLAFGRGTDRHQLSNIAEQARTEMGVETLDAVADRGYYSSEEIRACEEAGITVTLPKPMISNAKAAGRFGKQDFR